MSRSEHRRFPRRFQAQPRVSRWFTRRAFDGGTVHVRAPLPRPATAMAQGDVEVLSFTEVKRPTEAVHHHQDTNRRSQCKPKGSL